MELQNRRVAAEAFTELLNSSRKVSSHGFFRIRSRTVHPLAQRASLVHDPPRGTCTIEDRLQKALRCRDCIRKNLSSGLAYGTADMALNGGHDALVLLAGEERTAASCSTAQRGSFCISSDLQHTPTDRRAEVQRFIQNIHDAALARHGLVKIDELLARNLRSTHAVARVLS